MDAATAWVEGLGGRRRQPGDFDEHGYRWRILRATSSASSSGPRPTGGSPARGGPRGALARLAPAHYHRARWRTRGWDDPTFIEKAATGSRSPKESARPRDLADRFPLMG
ncbi:MAG: hypothetical protein HYU54_11535 [Actinobacteria bacterium]|nr:hypothetical protein [Actinomycetota bacterium]